LSPEGSRKKINAVILRTDVIIKELFKKPAYSEEEKKRTYDEFMLF